MIMLQVASIFLPSFPHTLSRALLSVNIFWRIKKQRNVSCAVCLISNWKMVMKFPYHKPCISYDVVRQWRWRLNSAVLAQSDIIPSHLSIFTYHFNAQQREWQNRQTHKNSDKLRCMHSFASHRSKLESNNGKFLTAAAIDLSEPMENFVESIWLIGEKLMNGSLFELCLLSQRKNVYFRRKKGTNLQLIVMQIGWKWAAAEHSYFFFFQKKEKFVFSRSRKNELFSSTMVVFRRRGTAIAYTYAWPTEVMHDS